MREPSISNQPFFGCGREVFTRSRQFQRPVCHRGISPSGYIQFLHQSRGFPFPDNFCAKGTERKSSVLIIPQSSREGERRPNRNLRSDQNEISSKHCLVPCVQSAPQNREGSDGESQLRASMQLSSGGGCSITDTVVIFCDGTEKLLIDTFMNQ